MKEYCEEAIRQLHQPGNLVVGIMFIEMAILGQDLEELLEILR